MFNLFSSNSFNGTTGVLYECYFNVSDVKEHVIYTTGAGAPPEPKAAAQYKTSWTP